MDYSTILEDKGKKTLKDNHRPSGLPVSSPIQIAQGRTRATSSRPLERHRVSSNRQAEGCWKPWRWGSLHWNALRHQDVPFVPTQKSPRTIPYPVKLQKWDHLLMMCPEVTAFPKKHWSLFSRCNRINSPLFFSISLYIFIDTYNRSIYSFSVLSLYVETYNLFDFTDS